MDGTRIDGLSDHPELNARNDLQAVGVQVLKFGHCSGWNSYACSMDIGRTDRPVMRCGRRT